MSVPQKEKEGPASMLRAMFAGVGSLLSFVDKARGKRAPEAPAAPAAAAPETSAALETVVAETNAAPETVAPETSAAPETVVAETSAAPETNAAPETVTPETSAAPETVTPETSAAPETVAPGAAAALPLANYDESTVASLRARLRNLSVDQLTQLIEYERGHAARPDVISMFERRIAKVEAEA
jgi:hypothetical protein